MRIDTDIVASFGEKRHPYYIFGADYRETSGGVTALHYLCHALNKAGESAYLLNTKISKPGLNIRFLTEADCRHHKTIQAVPIVVYPEIVSDNPYDGLAVVRYMLNRDGLLTGRKVERGPVDLTFYHSPQFVDPDEMSPEVMQVPVLDDELFSPLQSPVKRSKPYLFVGRTKREDMDFSLLPAAVEALDISNPKSLQELAAIFQTASVLYSYEVSGTCICAMLSGCPVIYIKNPNLAEIPGQVDYSTDGAAFHDEIGGLERARATVGKVRRHWQGIKDSFPEQLRNFIQKTQALADFIRPRTPYAADFIMQRVFPEANENDHSSQENEVR